MYIRTQARPETPWESLNVLAAPTEGPAAFGGDLGPRSLLTAYRHGLYPFPAETAEHCIVNELTYEADVAAGRVKLIPGYDDPFSIAWCSPDPRPVILVQQARIQRSLRRQLRKETGWTTTADVCFERVARQCRAGRTERWLTDDLLRGLCLLHELGHAHSVEVWDGDELIGGVLGVRVGAVFSADSQFTLRSGAGKAAVADLTRRFAEAGGLAVDVQRDGDHVRLLGAQPMSRRQYFGLLSARDEGRPLATGRLPARRLAD
ncbi:leucyl/phenylalanyl-tRNA--protein transferase [Streptomyces capitiformicae]|uniref:leucyl/phenylalanyl-tRNA--protein transferase n=1 Tax=Streptomyces capitiformicae TaxID=2014920 RepID=UPI001AD80C26|nr:leucyl/phenylalanyl-tRNA--protein transferase [Streptomyces capitiformicae]